MVASAALLQGLVLDGGWTVISPVPKEFRATGGYFSICYIVENSKGDRAFLKALDYSKAFNSADPARSLQAMTETFNFERDVLNKCKNDRLDRVVTAITDGTVRIENQPDAGVVQYIIFELADGDVRRQANLNTQFDLAWSLRSLHHIATGLQQIHSHGIAHQDLKPSNVLVFNGNSSKIADFGRAAYKGHNPPHENEIVPGDYTYAPPDQLYRFIDPNWYARRFGCDAYLLGSMAVFFFLGTGLTPLLFMKLPQPYHYDYWTGTYEEVMPYLKDAFQQILEDYRQNLPVPLQNDLVSIVTQLCEPDPRLRGHPKTLNSSNQFSMERYVSWFNRLARHAELGVLHLLQK
ncbi:MAG: protein kinase domain-containing protein [Bellilinea sp.]